MEYINISTIQVSRVFYFSIPFACVLLFGREAKEKKSEIFSKSTRV